LVKAEQISWFKDFYLRHFNAVAGFANTFVKDKDIALDIAQDAMFRVFSSYNDKFTQENCLPFLYKTTRNLCIDHLRSSKFRSVAIDETLSRLIHDNNLFLDEITKQEAQENIRRAVSELSGRSYEIIIMSLKGMSIAEISDKLGISVNTIKTIKKSAFVKLRSLLSREHFSLLLLYNIF